MSNQWKQKHDSRPIIEIDGGRMCKGKQKHGIVDLVIITTIYYCYYNGMLI